MGFGVWGLGMGNGGLGIGPTPKPQIPNPQSPIPIPNPQINNYIEKCNIILLNFNKRKILTEIMKII